MEQTSSPGRRWFAGDGTSLRDEKYTTAVQASLYLLVEAAASVVGAERGYVYMPINTQSAQAPAELAAVCAVEPVQRARLPGTYHPTRNRCPVAQGLCGTVFSSGVAVNVAGRSGDDDETVSPSTKRSRRDRNSLCFPLRSGSGAAANRRTIGVLQLSDKHQGGEAFTSRDIAIIWAYARLVESVLVRYPHDITQEKFDPAVLAENSSSQCNPRRSAAKGMQAILNKLPQEAELVCHTADPSGVDGLNMTDVSRRAIPLLSEKQLLTQLGDFAAELGSTREMWREATARATDMQTENEALLEEVRVLRRKLESARRELGHMEGSLEGRIERIGGEPHDPLGPPSGSFYGPPRVNTAVKPRGKGGKAEGTVNASKVRSAYRKGVPLSKNPLHALHMSGPAVEEVSTPGASTLASVILEPSGVDDHIHSARMVDAAVQASPAEALTAHVRQRRGAPRVSPRQGRGGVSFWDAMDDQQRSARQRILPSLTNTPRRPAAALGAEPSDMRAGHVSARAAVILQEVGKLGIELARKRNQKVEDVGVLTPMLSLEQDHREKQAQSDALRGLERRVHHVFSPVQKR